MGFFHNSISADQQVEMNLNDPFSKTKQMNRKSVNHLNIPACDQSRSAIIDILILIAVTVSCIVLLYPYASFLVHKSVEIGKEVIDILMEEIVRAPLVFACLGISLLFTSLALVVIIAYTDPNCGKPGCRGLRKAAEFDIQLETEESVKKSTCLVKNALKNGLYELQRDRHKDLESELKKMAPVNGRAVLIFRARCGCSIGRMEVPGPKKYRKVKK